MAEKEREKYEVKVYKIDRASGYNAPELRLIAKGLGLHPHWANEIHDVEVKVRFYNQKEREKFKSQK